MLARLGWPGNRLLSLCLSLSFSVSVSHSPLFCLVVFESRLLPSIRSTRPFDRRPAASSRLHCLSCQAAFVQAAGSNVGYDGIAMIESSWPCQKTRCCFLVPGHPFEGVLHRHLRLWERSVPVVLFVTTGALHIGWHSVPRKGLSNSRGD